MGISRQVVFRETSRWDIRCRGRIGRIVQAQGDTITTIPQRALGKCANTGGQRCTARYAVVTSLRRIGAEQSPDDSIEIPVGQVGCGSSSCPRPQVFGTAFSYEAWAAGTIAWRASNSCARSDAV
ncbi:MAG TPA: hypothetical protein VJN01_09555, partial [Xanthomonadales bacterium]|nr:hypothetical protein [Xanthomonadales bacterium]